MREAIKSAIKANMRTIILGFPFVLWLFASLFIGNHQLRQQLADQQQYYEARLAADERENRERHATSLEHRAWLESELKEIKERLRVSDEDRDRLRMLPPGR